MMLMSLNREARIEEAHRSTPLRSSSVQFCLFRFSPVWFSQVQSSLVWSNSVRFSPFRFSPVRSGLVWSGRVRSGLIRSWEKPAFIH